MKLTDLKNQTVEYLKYAMASGELLPADAIKLLGILVNIEEAVENPAKDEGELPLEGKPPSLNILLPIYTSEPITVTSKKIL
jgi:hypothetical protein